jgi:recombination protein RecA
MAKESLIHLIAKDLKKEFGNEGTVEVGIMGDGLFHAQPKEWVTTGVTLLDAALAGGVPLGKVMEIFGEESTGKSLLCLCILAAAQRQNYFTVYADAEQATTKEFAQHMAQVDPEKLLLIDAETLEEALDASIAAIDKVRARDTQIPVIIGIDSVAGFQTREERDGLIEEDQKMAAAAKVIRKWLRKTTRKLAHERAAVVFTNHETARIGVQFGPKWTTYGGTGGRFGASLRVRLQQTARLKESDRYVGLEVRATVFKTRFSAPWREVTFPIFFEGGLDDITTTVNYLYKNHHFGQKTGFLIWEDKSYRKLAFIEKVRQDSALHEQLTKEATRLFQGTKVQEDDDVVEGA